MLNECNEECRRESYDTFFTFKLFSSSYWPTSIGLWEFVLTHFFLSFFLFLKILSIYF